MAQVHQALADPLRILIICMLLEQELLVGEMVTVLKEPQHKVSRHLAVLKKAGVLRDRREGTRVHYEISPTLGAEWKEALERLRRCWDRSPEVKAALWRLQQTVSRRPDNPKSVKG
jgi:DNA-binding transcriptional ArsR family regulator